ncbi:MAG: hypothetical protein D6734_13125, partial [Candidatus Schekmanbacteria bacterium]
YLYSPEGRILENFLVVIKDDVISYVGKSASPSVEADYDIGNSILLPGFINAHCHLELTGFKGKIKKGISFAGWVEDIISLKIRTSKKEYSLFIREGIKEAVRGGCTFFSDISSSYLSAPLLNEAGVRGIVFYEAIGFKNEESDYHFERLKEAIEKHKKEQYSNICAGISPHAVYSVSSSLFKKCVEYSKKESLPLQVHLGETVEESLFLEKGEGIFFTLLSFLGQLDEDWEAKGIPPIIYMKELGFLDNRNTFVHFNFYTNEELDILSKTENSVVVCPLSNNEWFERETSPLFDCIEKEINLAIGTDSCASNFGLNMFDELRMLKKICPSLTPYELIKTATVNGAYAFCMSEKLGRIEEGFYADLIAVPVDFVSADKDLIEGVIEESKEVNFSMVGGKEIYSCL